MDKIIIEDTEDSFETEKSELITSGDYNENDIFYLFNGSMCHTKTDFFHHFAKLMHFPDHFSDNWDSFIDCFHDGIFVPEKNILVYIENMTELLEDDKKGLYFFYDLLYGLKNNAIDSLVTILFNFEERQL